MTVRTRTLVLFAFAVTALLVAAYLLGRGHGRAADGARNAPAPAAGSYFDGLRTGQAQGREEGRILQLGESPSGSRQPSAESFAAGYTAGSNDVFDLYDGGWTLGEPYLVTLESGAGAIAYRIAHRLVLTAGTDYYLCGDGKQICQQPRK